MLIKYRYKCLNQFLKVQSDDEQHKSPDQPFHILITVQRTKSWECVVAYNGIHRSYLTVFLGTPISILQRYIVGGTSFAHCRRVLLVPLRTAGACYSWCLGCSKRHYSTTGPCAPLSISREQSYWPCVWWYWTGDKSRAKCLLLGTICWFCLVSYDFFFFIFHGLVVWGWGLLIARVLSSLSPRITL